MFVHMNATYSIFSRLAGKQSHMNKTKLFGESKYFLPNRDYVFPYEQALRLYHLPGNACIDVKMATLEPLGCIRNLQFRNRKAS